jgi:hypothetical protein
VNTPPRPVPVVRRELLLPAVIVFVLVWAGASLMRPGFWVLDESVLYMQGTSLLSSLRLPPPLLLPGVSEGERPDPRFAPVPFHYGRVEDGLVYAQYSPALALTSLPFRALFGHAGTFAVPALGAALCWLLLASSFLGNGFGRLQAFVLPVAGAPVLFYGMTFWSHTLASGLVLGAVALTLSGRRCALPVLLISAAALFREEALPFLAFPLLLGKGSPWKKLALLSVAALALLTVSRLLTGSWLGTHFQASGTEQDLYGHAGMGWGEARWFVLCQALLTFMPGIPGWANLAGGVLLTVLWATAAFSGRGRAGPAASTAGLALAAVALTVALWRGFRLLDVLYYLKSPLLIFPALWLVRPRGRSPLIPAGILVLMLFLMGPMHAEDLAWGSRLTMLPLLVLLLSAAPASPRKNWAVIGVGILGCLVSIGFLARKRALSDDLVTLAVREGGAVIVTDWLLAGEFAAEMEKGVPVVFTPFAEDFAEASTWLQDFQPVAVSRIEDLGTQMQLFRDLGFSPSIAGVVEFDPALRVAVVNLSGTGEP